MDLSNIIAKEKTYAKYMLKEITHICKDFEKRAPGSKGEEQACVTSRLGAPPPAGSLRHRPALI